MNRARLHTRYVASVPGKVTKRGLKLITRIIATRHSVLIVHNGYDIEKSIGSQIPLNDSFGCEIGWLSGP
jgi:hypothetical protein